MALPVKRCLLIFALLLASGATSTGFAQPQTQDTNKLHDPMIARPGFVSPLKRSPKEGSTVITIGNFDNFKLGVDFAECSIAVNPLNPLEMYAAWNAFTEVAEQGYRTEDGYSWIPSNPDWHSMSGDVVVVSDSEGRLCFMNMSGLSITGSKVATSNDFGRTWNKPVLAISGNDKPWIAADQTGGPYSKYLYTTMSAMSGGNHALSADGGATYTTTRNFDEHRLPGMSVCVGPDGATDGGSVYVVTVSGASASPVYTFWVSHDGGQTFTMQSARSFANNIGSTIAGRNSVENMRTRPYPNIAADNSTGPHRGRLYLVYASNNPAGSGNKPDIFCHYSDDQALTWSQPYTVNDDPGSTSNHNFFPAIAINNRSGRLYLSWMDTRDCPTSDSALIYATYTDDGEAFAPNVQLSQKKMKINCTTCGGGGAPSYYGDYNGVASNDKVSVMAWTDFRDGNFGSYLAYFPDFALSLDSETDTLQPYAHFQVNVPAVKLYSDSVIISAAITPNPELFDITFPGGNLVTRFPGSAALQVKPLATVPVGDYQLEVTARGPNGTPVHKRKAAISSIAFVQPAASFGVSVDSVCAGVPLNFTDLSAGPATTWQWSFPGATPSASAERNPQGIVYHQGGRYDVTLTVTNEKGSSSLTRSQFINIREASPPPAAAGASVCQGEPVPALHASGTSLTWYSGQDAVSHDSVFVTGKTDPGEYTYFVTQNTNLCESAKVPVTLSIHPRPAAVFNPPYAVCISLPAFQLTQGTPAGGVYSGAGITGGQTFSPAAAGAGTHTLQYIYTDQFGCKDTAFQQITVIPAAAVSLDTVMPLCENAPRVKLSGNPAGGTFAGNGVANDFFDPSESGSGMAELSYTIIDTITGCPATAKKSVLVYETPKIHLADQSTCGNRTITFDASASGAVLYLWMPGGATTSAIVVDTAGHGLGTAVYTVTATSAHGCAVTDTAAATFYDCTGIGDQEAAAKFSISPNPNAGIFEVVTDISVKTGLYELEVNDASGKMLLRKQVVLSQKHNRIPVDLSQLPSGVYMLQLEGKSLKTSSRLIIAR